MRRPLTLGKYHTLRSALICCGSLLVQWTAKQIIIPRMSPGTTPVGPPLVHRCPVNLRIPRGNDITPGSPSVESGNIFQFRAKSEVSIMHINLLFLNKEAGKKQREFAFMHSATLMLCRQKVQSDRVCCVCARVCVACQCHARRLGSYVTLSKPLTLMVHDRSKS